MDKTELYFSRRRRRRIAVATLLCIVGGLLVADAAHLSQRLKSEEYDLDLASGRERVTCYVLWYPVRQEVRETPVSQVLTAGGGQSAQPRWVRLYGNSGILFVLQWDGIYGGAAAAINGLGKVWEMGEFDAQAKAKSAKQLLQCVCEGGSGSAGWKYLNLLQKLMDRRTKRGPVSQSEIPDNLAEQIGIRLRSAPN